MTDFTGLAVAGRIATPDDSDWDQARLAWNLAADQQPIAVVVAESAEDVAATVGFAAGNDLKVAAQGTGHGAAPLAALDGTILLKTERMRGVKIDPNAGTARVEAGVLSLELAEAAGEHGMCSLPGSSPDVGVIGYTLGGGLSWLGRRYGFACNRVRAIELVTAEGEPRTVDAENDADLFWALRGGGGGYAVVTALHVNLLPIDEIYAGALVFPAEVGAEAVRAYRDWAAGVPEEVTSVVRFLTPPPIPDVPEPIRGKPLLTIDGACVGGQAEAKRRPRRCARSARRSWTPSPGCPPLGCAGSTWTPRTRCPGSAKEGRFATCPTRRSTPSSRSPDQIRARRCCSASCAISVERSAAPTRAAAPSRTSTPASPCTASACR
jgi:FAD/FMN-containing dehydrogenase